MASKYTNFSVDEILKSQFGASRKYFDNVIIDCLEYATVYQSRTDTTKTPVLSANINRHSKPEQPCQNPESTSRVSTLVRVFNDVRMSHGYEMPHDTRLSNDARDPSSDGQSSDTILFPIDRSADVRISHDTRIPCGTVASRDPRVTSKSTSTGTPGWIGSPEYTALSLPTSSSDPRSGEVVVVDDTFSSTLPAWVFCTRYSDRPSAGPRSKRQTRKKWTKADQRRRTSFSSEQLSRLTQVFETRPYLSEHDMSTLSCELKLKGNQIKIWFQNKRAKSKRASGQSNPLAKHLKAQGLYNHMNEQTRPLLF